MCCSMKTELREKKVLFFFFPFYIPTCSECRKWRVGETFSVVWNVQINKRFMHPTQLFPLLYSISLDVPTVAVTSVSATETTRKNKTFHIIPLFSSFCSVIINIINELFTWAWSALQNDVINGDVTSYWCTPDGFKDNLEQQDDKYGNQNLHYIFITCW